MRKLRKGILYLLGAACVVAVVGLSSGSNPGDFKLGRDMEILMNVFREINLFYVDETDPDKVLEDAAEGMTSKLDPYTEFMPESEMERFEIMTTGKYGGIGALIRQKGDYVVIAQPYKGFPADKAGLKIGDKFVEIDGNDAKGYTTEQVSSSLKGDPGTKVTVKVEKFMSGRIEELTIKRERIAISGVPYHGFVSEGIGYIQHSDFTENCSDDLLKALMEMKRSGQMEGLILDYRSNSGGILQEAVKILSYFVPKGTDVVSMNGRREQTNAVFTTKSEPVEEDMPIVVLTNSGSASAAEIVSGAFQDLDRAVLMGQRTFGKGLVQSPRPVGYNAYLKLTTAKYYIPSGRCIQAVDYAHRNEDGSVGVVPDSLIKEFETRAGRKVYDGGGVMPDVKLEADYVSRFALILYARGYIEDFVDEWIKANPSPDDVVSFSLSDADYAAFERFMEDKSVEYESETKRALADLRKKAERDRYADRITDQLDAIEQAIKDDKQTNLRIHRQEIGSMIEEEIVLRDNYWRGVTRRRLAQDDEVKAAIELLRNKERYQTIVTSKDTDRK